MLFMQIIPAPQRHVPGNGFLRLGRELTVSFGDTVLAPLAEWFCADIERRTGICLTVGTKSGHADIDVALADDPEFAVVTPPLGVDPASPDTDESYILIVGDHRAQIKARQPVGAFRGLTSLLQLVAAAPRDSGGSVALQAQRLIDGPRFAWRGLSLDLARRFFPPVQIRRVIDLLALYKFNVLHLHLTDDVAWRIEAGRPAALRRPDGTFYTNSELQGLVDYAAKRFIAVVPEVDTPGHAAALVDLRPQLRSGRNVAHYKRVSGITQQSAWLDPELPETVEVMANVFQELAEIFPGRFFHVGGDEAWQMPDDVYRDYVRRLLPIVTALGKAPIGWQELVRANAAETQMIQFWMSQETFRGPGRGRPLPAETATLVAANAARTLADILDALRDHIKVVMSPSANCYLDVPYAEQSSDPAQALLHQHVGLRSYRPLRLEETFDWEPVTALGSDAKPLDVAGVEAAMWCETVQNFGDLTFALLPRLAGIAEKGWSMATSWTDHSTALGWHARLWNQDGLAFFRAESVPWSRRAAW